MDETSPIGGLLGQHPVEEYINRISRAYTNAQDGRPPFVFVDRAGICRAVPMVYGITPKASWRPIGTDNPCEDRTHYDCDCPESVNSAVVAAVAGDQSPNPGYRPGRKTSYLGDRSEHWIGHCEVEVAGQKVQVFGLVFGDGYSDVEHHYVVASRSAEIADAFGRDVRARIKKDVADAAKSHIFVSDSVGVPRPDMDWDDVVLQDTHRETIERNVEAFFKAKEQYHKHGLAYRRGLLLVGPPGNGKSSIIKILAARRRDVAFFMYGFSTTGNDTERLRQLFDKAVEHSPSIVVLEDIDRVVAGGTMRAVLNILDGVSAMSGVLVIATSNNAGDIDSALIERPSRFDLVLRINEPDKEQRLVFLRRLLSGLGTEEQMAALAQETASYSMAMLQEIFTGALLESVLHGREPAWEDVITAHRRLEESRAVARKELGKSKASGVGFKKGKGEE